MCWYPTPSALVHSICVLATVTTQLVAAYSRRASAFEPTFSYVAKTLLSESTGPKLVPVMVTVSSPAVPSSGMLETSEPTANAVGIGAAYPEKGFEIVVWCPTVIVQWKLPPTPGTV